MCFAQRTYQHWILFEFVWGGDRFALPAVRDKTFAFHFVFIRAVCGYLILSL